MAMESWRINGVLNFLKLSVLLTLQLPEKVIGELRPEQYKRLCYFNNWSQDRDKVAQLWPEQVSHLNVTYMR